MPAWYEPEPCARLICSKRNGRWVGQIVSKQVPQQGHSKYGNIFPYSGDMDRSVHYYSNQVYKYLFKDDYTLKLIFWPSGHCEWIFISFFLGCRSIYQWQSITSCLLNTCPFWWKNCSIHFSVILLLWPEQKFGINLSGVYHVWFSSIFSKCFFLDHLHDNI